MTIESAVIGGFVGDALSLGPHWIYEQEEIAMKIGRPDRLLNPLSSYHPGKRAGDFTHYGDQALVLLKHLRAHGGFSLDAYAEEWRKFWEEPRTISYRDGATKETLSKLQAGVPVTGAGSVSSDLAGASRMVPLFGFVRGDEELLAACREFTAFTHRNASVIGAAEFFARVVLDASRGVAIPVALDRAAEQVTEKLLLDGLLAARDSAAGVADDRRAIEDHGLSCNVQGAFPAVIHLLLRYPDAPEAGLIANGMAGGDSAARGMLLGAVYGAAGTLDRVPGEWIEGINALETIRECMRMP